MNYLDVIKESMDLYNNIEPYDYEKYKTINPKLTKRMYEHLRFNGVLWKVICGKRVEIRHANEVLEEVWWRWSFEDNIDKYPTYPS
mgnify:CR=1 FL=1